MPPAKSSPTRVSDLCSRVLVPTFSVVLLALVCFPSTIRSSFLCSEKPSRVDLDRKCPPRTCTEYSPWIGEVGVHGGRCGRCDWRQAERCIRRCSTRFPKLLYSRDLVIFSLYFPGLHWPTPLGSSIKFICPLHTQIDRCGRSSESIASNRAKRVPVPATNVVLHRVSLAMFTKTPSSVTYSIYYGTLSYEFRYVPSK